MDAAGSLAVQMWPWGGTAAYSTDNPGTPTQREWAPAADWSVAIEKGSVAIVVALGNLWRDTDWCKDM